MFLDYWMNKNVKTLCWPIAMYNSEKKIITSQEKINLLIDTKNILSQNNMKRKIIITDY